MELIEKNKESTVIGLHWPGCGAAMGYFVLGVSSPPLSSSILQMTDRAARVPGKNPTGLCLHSGMGDEEYVCLLLGTRVPRTKRETMMEAG